MSDGPADLDAESSEVSGPEKRVLGRPFLPGQSGNPGGRPKKQELFVLRAQEMSMEVLERWFVIALAGKGLTAVRAGENIVAYAFGKPREAVELTGANGGPVEVTDPNRPSDEELRAKVRALLEAARKASPAPPVEPSATTT